MPPLPDATTDDADDSNGGRSKKKKKKEAAKGFTLARTNPAASFCINR
jgi:hypothetical protein